MLIVVAAQLHARSRRAQASGWQARYAAAILLGPGHTRATGSASVVPTWAHASDEATHLGKQEQVGGLRGVIPHRPAWRGEGAERR